MRRIFARQTLVREISLEETSSFMEINHRQGMPTRFSSPYCYGLFFQDEMVAASIFSNPRTGAARKKYCHELLRMAFAPGTRVVGGASKMISSFIKERDPYNFFTYQSTSGETTDVYEKSGMKLAGSSKNKKILVKNGLTAETAKDNREDWFSMEQVVRFGPDNLLKINLGEKFNDSGKRLTNVELFTDILNYHLEDVPGDRLYEWHNPKIWHYTYRISSTDSEKYYYGRKCIRSNSVPLKEDCLSDGYYGSGGKKFQNWKNSHSENLLKEVISIHDRWGDAVKDEEFLIGDLHRSDPNCLNSLPGGVSVGYGNGEIVERNCSVHGLAKHRGNQCLSCLFEKSLSKEECEKHGLSFHRSHICLKCKSSNSPTILGECKVHGKTNFRFGHCLKCRFSMKNCPVHGLTKYMNDSCTRCSRSKFQVKASVGNCSIHGASTFIGDNCTKCSVEKSIDTEECPLHGEVKHRNGKCFSCINSPSVSFDKCSEHGEDNLHVRNSCLSCLNDRDGDFKLIFESKKSVSGPRYSFSCHLCNHRWEENVSRVLNRYFEDGACCPFCVRSSRFWSGSETMRRVARFLPDLPIVVSTKGKERYESVCPACGFSRKITILTLVRSARSGRSLCPKGCEVH